MKIPIVWAALTEAELIIVIHEAAQEEYKRWLERNPDGSPTLTSDHRVVESHPR
jgi:hypothetical protein